MWAASKSLPPTPSQPPSQLVLASLRGDWLISLRPAPGSGGRGLDGEGDLRALAVVVPVAESRPHSSSFSK